MKILIIGCGYVGKAIAKLWQETGHLVTVTTTTPAKLTELKAIANQAILFKSDQLEQFSEIIADQELILLTIGASSRTEEAYKNTYLKTAQNLAKILPQNQSVKQVIYTGSYSILGNHNGAWVTEETPPQPLNESNLILQQTEQILLSLSAPVNTAILRLAGIYGPGREIKKIFSNWTGKTRPGTGQEFSNWIHLEDIVNALELIRQKSLTGIYHLANDYPLTKQELLDRMCQKYHLPTISWTGSQPETVAYNLRLSNQKIKDAGLNLIYPETIV
jgi:nucleoside-diphosphate-sugar epimerase